MWFCSIPWWAVYATLWPTLFNLLSWNGSSESDFHVSTEKPWQLSDRWVNTFRRPLSGLSMVLCLQVHSSPYWIWPLLGFLCSPCFQAQDSPLFPALTSLWFSGKVFCFLPWGWSALDFHGLLSSGISDEEDQKPVRLPLKVPVELQPRNNHAWARVQSLAQNPRLRWHLAWGRDPWQAGFGVRFTQGILEKQILPSALTAYKDRVWRWHCHESALSWRVVLRSWIVILPGKGLWPSKRISLWVPTESPSFL